MGKGYFEPRPDCLRCGQPNRKGQLACPNCKKEIAREQYLERSNSEKKKVLREGCCKQCKGRAGLIFLVEQPAKCTVSELKNAVILCLNCLLDNQL